jgi:hypothetical protein
MLPGFYFGDGYFGDSYQNPYFWRAEAGQAAVARLRAANAG